MTSLILFIVTKTFDKKMIFFPEQSQIASQMLAKYLSDEQAWHRLDIDIVWLSLYIWACVFETQINTFKSIGKQACRIPKKKAKQWCGLVQV